MSQEEQKVSDVRQDNLQKKDLSYVHISTDVAKNHIVLKPVLKKEAQNKHGQKKCKLFKINKGKQLIYNSITDIFKANKEQNGDIQNVEITLVSETTASYMLIQALADLQFNNILDILNTQDKTTKDTYEVEVTVRYPKKPVEIQNQ